MSDENNIYQAPQSSGLEDEEKPLLIKLAVLLVGVFLVVGITDGLILGEFLSEDISLDIGIMIFYWALTLLIAYWVHKPIALRIENAHHTPLTFCIIFIAFLMFDLNDEAYTIDVPAYLQIFEIVIMFVLFMILRSATGKTWCNQAIDKNNNTRMK